MTVAKSIPKLSTQPLWRHSEFWHSAGLSLSLTCRRKELPTRSNELQRQECRRSIVNEGISGICSVQPRPFPEGLIILPGAEYWSEDGYGKLQLQARCNQGGCLDDFATAPGRYPGSRICSLGFGRDAGTAPRADSGQCSNSTTSSVPSGIPMPVSSPPTTTLQGPQIKAGMLTPEHQGAIPKVQGTYSVTSLAS